MTLVIGRNAEGMQQGVAGVRGGGAVNRSNPNVDVLVVDLKDDHYLLLMKGEKMWEGSGARQRCCEPG